MFRFRDAEPGDEPAVREVVFSVLREFGFAPEPGATDADLEDLRANYQEGGGRFRVLVTEDGTIVGCGGLCRVSGEEAELRKMYFLPEARGRGLGSALLRDLVDHARRQGFRRIVLETASVLAHAGALYRRHGFVEVNRVHLTPRCDQALALE